MPTLDSRFSEKGQTVPTQTQRSTISRRALGLLALGSVVTLPACAPLDALSGNSDVVRLPTVEGGRPRLVVDRVDVRVMESFPVQVQADVTGSLPDPCTIIAGVSQTRSGNAIVVTITIAPEPDKLCAQVITPIDLSMPLKGEFPAGDYTVTVNGVVATFRV